MSANRLNPKASIQPKDPQRANGHRIETDGEKMVIPPDAEQAETVKEKVDPPPNGGYGWVCVVCVFCINAHTWGINSVRSLPILLEVFR